MLKNHQLVVHFNIRQVINNRAHKESGPCYWVLKWPHHFSIFTIKPFAIINLCPDFTLNTDNDFPGYVVTHLYVYFSNIHHRYVSSIYYGALYKYSCMLIVALHDITSSWFKCILTCLKIVTDDYIVTHTRKCVAYNHNCGVWIIIVNSDDEHCVQVVHNPSTWKPEIVVFYDMAQCSSYLYWKKFFTFIYHTTKCVKAYGVHKTENIYIYIANLPH